MPIFAKMKKVATLLIRYFMLAAGIVLLLTVIVPHHHHEDGTPCIHMSDQDTHGHEVDGHATDPSHHHADCGGSGHTIVFNVNTSSGHSADNHTDCCLMPLVTLYDYTYPPRIDYATLAFYSDKAVYIESLHDTWIPAAVGLRAPPAVIG